MARQLPNTRTFAFRPPAPVGKKAIDSFKDVTVLASNRCLASLWKQVAKVAVAKKPDPEPEDYKELAWLRPTLGPLKSPSWTLALKLVIAYVTEFGLTETVQTISIEQGKRQPGEPIDEEEEEEAPPPPPPPPRPVSRSRSREGESDKRSVAPVDKDPKTLTEAIQRVKFPPRFRIRVEQFAKETGLDKGLPGEGVPEASEEK